MDLQLLNKVALVTGGSRGIGKAIARQLALEGADVAICARNEGVAEATAREIAKESGRRVLPFVVDVGVASQVDRMVASVHETFGHIDILVNNAGQPGGLASGPLATVTDEAMQQDLNVKLMGYLRCARAVAPHMQKLGWGRIINVGGTSARTSGTYSTGIRNIAVVHLSKSMADELGAKGITVNVVHPGMTKTPYLDNILAGRAKREGKSVQEVEQDLARSNSVRHIIEPSEIANVVAFLASPRASAITGEVIGVGGGVGRAVTF